MNGEEAVSEFGEPRPYLECSEDLVHLGDHHTTVVDLGRGAVPMVIVHSLGLDWRMAGAMLPTIAARRRVIAYDLRLHGTAATAQPETFTLETCADDLASLLDALAVERAHVAGFSLGGAVAQHFALRHPDRIAALSLVCTMSRAPRAVYLERAATAEREGMEAQVVPTMTRWFNTPALATNGWAVRYAREKIRRVPPARWARYWRALSEIDTLDSLPRLAVPTAVIAAQSDRSTSPESMRAIAAAIPGASFQVVADAPHMIALEHPEATTRILTAP